MVTKNMLVLAVSLSNLVGVLQGANRERDLQSQQSRSRSCAFSGVVGETPILCSPSKVSRFLPEIET